MYARQIRTNPGKPDSDPPKRVGCNTFRRPDSIGARTAASSALRLRPGLGGRALGLRAHGVRQFEQMAQRCEFTAGRKGSDRFHVPLPLPCPSARPEYSAGRALLSDCLLVARKFCTVRQTSIKIAHNRLGRDFPDIAVPWDLGRGFRNG